MANSSLSHKFNNIIPQEINSEIKITKRMSMRTLIFLVASVVVTQQLNGLVHPSLRLPYAVFSVLVSGFLVLPSIKNPGKQMFQLLLLSFTKDLSVYHPDERKEFE